MGDIPTELGGQTVRDLIVELLADQPMFIGDFELKHDSAASQLQFTDSNGNTTYIPTGTAVDLSTVGYGDSDAIDAINNDADHGSTAPHNYYTDSDAETAINNDADHGSTASHNYLQTTDVTSANWNDYEIQKDGTDGSGVINFKTV